jgi:AraC-like DNA-binding protein
MYVTELINYMETSQPYLEPSLKINELAQSLSIPSKSLSQSINQQLGKNFYDFVNSYRIEEAKKKIVKANGNGRTILEILYDSGFNSKAAFNRAFKKHTGITPTEYKNLL